MIHKLIVTVIITISMLNFFVSCSTAPPPKVPAEDSTLQEIIQSIGNGDYGQDTIARYENGVINLNVFNFAPYGTELTETQKTTISNFGADLFDILKTFQYDPIEIKGYANPTGIKNEQNELMRISQARADNMAAFLREAGLKIGETRGLGAEKIIDSSGTEEAKGMNRHVEITISNITRE